MAEQPTETVVSWDKFQYAKQQSCNGALMDSVVSREYDTGEPFSFGPEIMCPYVKYDGITKTTPNEPFPKFRFVTNQYDTYKDSCGNNVSNPISIDNPNETDDFFKHAYCIDLKLPKEAMNCSKEGET